MAKGSIEKRGPASWRLTVEVGSEADGTRYRRRKTITIEDKALLKTKKALQEYLDDELKKFKFEVEAGEYISPDKARFADFVNEWRTKYAIKEYAPKTLSLTEHLLKNYICPYFDHYRMPDIKTMHIVTFFDKMSKPGVRKDGKNEPFSPSTLTSMHRLLRVIFKTAVTWQVLKKSPMEGLKYPKLPKRRAACYDEEESTQLLKALQGEPLQWKVMIMLAITTGMRRGEICGLEWKHLNLDEGIAEVEQAIIYTKATKKKLTDPKTDGSARKLSIPDLVVDLLKIHRAESFKRRDSLGSKWKGEKDRFFVFTGPFGEPYTLEYISTKWKSFTEEKGLRFIKFHGLRHTSASLLIYKGIHAKVISERLGHSNINITMNTYGHVFRKADEAAAKTFDAMFNPSPIRPQNKKKRGKILEKSGN